MSLALKHTDEYQDTSSDICEVKLESDDVELFNLIKSKSFKTGDFTLSSGQKSNMYFNMKPTMMNAEGSRLSACAFLKVFHECNADVVSGLEMGAVPIIGAMAAMSSVQGDSILTTFVRKSPKMHGTKDVIEGLSADEIKGKNFLVVDDVATSGASILKAIEAVRDMGGLVDYAACLVDREEGGEELLRHNGVELIGVFKGRQFLDG